jgi:hypothetical protein
MIGTGGDVDRVAVFGGVFFLPLENEGSLSLLNAEELIDFLVYLVADLFAWLYVTGSNNYRIFIKAKCFQSDSMHPFSEI